MDVTDASYRIRNVQNDIIGLHDSTGTVVVSYSYDTWGKLVSISGSLKDSVGIKNPYRYRGYRYDEETGLYYLQSRYYNAEWGRFINADGIVGEVNEIMSCNMFAYCMNSPVNNIDSNGEFAILAILATVTLTKVVASVLTVATVVAVGYFASAIHTYSCLLYTSTLEVEGNPEYPAVRVQEFEEIINNIDQHGPRANLVTFEVPKRLLKYIENGGDGLLLKLDDPRDGTIYTGMVNEDGSIVGKNYDGTEIKKGDIAGGDSYAIDFAKVIVNKDINRSSNIKGKVTDKKGNPIKGAVITGSGIEGHVTTDANGEYFIEDVAPGQVILKVTHPSYNDRMCTIYHLNENETVTLNIEMLPKGTKPIISAETKFTGNIIVNRYKEGSDIAIGEPISKEIKIVKSGEEYSIKDTALKVEPGYYYKVDYKLKLVSQGKIDIIADEFKLKFDSSIKAKVTQENNPGWSENGS